jgi:hypothetical protein
MDWRFALFLVLHLAGQSRSRAETNFQKDGPSVAPSETTRKKDRRAGGSVTIL